MSRVVLTNTNIQPAGFAQCYGCRRQVFHGDAYTLHEYTSPERQVGILLCQHCDPVLGNDIQEMFKAWTACVA